MGDGIDVVISKPIYRRVWEGDLRNVAQILNKRWGRYVCAVGEVKTPFSGLTPSHDRRLLISSFLFLSSIMKK